MHRTPRLAPEPQPCYSWLHAQRLLNPRKRFGKPWRIRAHNALETVLEALRQATGADIAHNAATHGPGCGYPYHKPLPPEIAEQAAKSCGWYRLVAANPKEFGILVRLLYRGSSSRGYNSPCSWFPLWQFPQRFSSPYKAEKWLRKVVRAADRKLGGFRMPDGERIHCSYRALGAISLIGSKAPRKAAEKAAVLTLQRLGEKHGWSFHHSKRLSDFLGFSAALKLDMYSLRGLQPLQIAAALVDVTQPAAVGNIASWLQPAGY